MSTAVWDSRDIAVAAYVNMRCHEFGIRLVKVERNGKEARFFFRGDSEKIEQLTCDFASSESARFDASVGALKALGYARMKELKAGG